jgi:hypothetical protein
LRQKHNIRRIQANFQGGGALMGQYQKRRCSRPLRHGLYGFRPGKLGRHGQKGWTARIIAYQYGQATAKIAHGALNPYQRGYAELFRTHDLPSQKSAIAGGVMIVNVVMCDKMHMACFPTRLKLFANHFIAACNDRDTASGRWIFRIGRDYDAPVSRTGSRTGYAG